MRKRNWLFLAVPFILSACSNKDTTGDTSTIKLGIRENTIELWEEVGRHTKEKGLNLDIVTMNSGLDINQATTEGDLDANGYQTVAFMETWNELQDGDIVPAMTTIIAPLGLYSSHFDSLDALPEGAEIGIPNDPSNTARSLWLLEKAGLLTLSDDFNSVSGTEGIVENPKNLDFVLAEGAMLPRMLEDLDAAMVINGTALDAGMKLDESLIHEDEEQTPYINIVGTTEQKLKDLEKEFQIFEEVFKSDEIKQFITEHYEGNFLSVDRDVREVLEDYEKNYK